MIGSDSYQNPFPVNVTTLLILREVVNIDEERNSITIQLAMWSIWKDHGIQSSNATIKYV